MDHLTGKPAGKTAAIDVPTEIPFPHTWTCQAMLSPACGTEPWPEAQLPLPRPPTQPGYPHATSGCEKFHFQNFQPSAGQQGFSVAAKIPGAPVHCSSSRRLSRVPPSAPGLPYTQHDRACVWQMLTVLLPLFFFFSLFLFGKWERVCLGVDGSVGWVSSPTS